ncbi:MAG: signal peptidase II [Candidatus Peregrinibacteria bacterium]
MRPLALTIVMSFLAGILSNVLLEIFLKNRVPLLGSFAGLELSHNPGIAFGMRLPPLLQTILIVIALIVVGWLALQSVDPRKNANYQLSIINDQTGYGLIMGGGLANLLDRAMDGLVTDYIQVGSFPVFNVADSCISIGVAILLLEVLVSRKRKL